MGMKKIMLIILACGFLGGCVSSQRFQTLESTYVKLKKIHSEQDTYVEKLRNALRKASEQLNSLEQDCPALWEK